MPEKLSTREIARTIIKAVETVYNFTPGSPKRGGDMGGSLYLQPFIQKRLKNRVIERHGPLAVQQEPLPFRRFTQSGALLLIDALAEELTEDTKFSRELRRMKIDAAVIEETKRRIKL